MIKILSFGFMEVRLNCRRMNSGGLAFLFCTLRRGVHGVTRLFSASAFLPFRNSVLQSFDTLALLSFFGICNQSVSFGMVKFWSLLHKSDQGRDKNVCATGDEIEEP